MKKLVKVNSRKNTVEAFKSCTCGCLCHCATRPSASLSQDGSAYGAVVLYY